jgi:hypothetical protein
MRWFRLITCKNKKTYLYRKVKRYIFALLKKMPLTFSHPALILPAKYLPAKWISMTGLIIGSVAPDFEYFIRMRVESLYSHTWTGMFWFDLPLSLLLTFIYHYIIRNSFICNSPVFLKKRLSRYIDFNWMDYFKHHFFTVIICLLVGIASHIFWDGFTHPHGDFVKMLPFLHETMTFSGIHIPNFKVAQYISTILGGIIVFYAILRIPKATSYAKSRNPVYYWFIVIGTGIVAANLRILTGINYWDYSTVATSTLSGLIAGSIVAPLLLERIPAKK